MADKKEPKKIKINPIEYCHFCDYASVSMGGKLNMNGVFDRIFYKDLPANHNQMFVVTRFILPEGAHNITLTLMQQDEVLAKSTVEKKIEQKLAAHTHFWNIKNLEVKKEDMIELQILIEGKQIYVKRLPVVKVPEKK